MMADFLNLLAGAAPFLAWAIVIYLVLEAVWAVSLWVYGLRTLFKLHRDDLHEALTLERALSPLAGPSRDRNGNPVRPAD
jgi:hypothetical protein